MRRRFITLDVFTRNRFGGNPLAMVLDAQGLETAAMQAIAREFSHPETVFVLPPANAAHKASLRIFTPAAELHLQLRLFDVARGDHVRLELAQDHGQHVARIFVVLDHHDRAAGEGELERRCRVSGGAHISSDHVAHS